MSLNLENKRLFAHLLRRAGLGATRSEVEQLCRGSYEDAVEELLYPKHLPNTDDDLIRRYHVDQNSLMLIESSQAHWLYKLINTSNPLEEKMALFWHGLFATAYGKLNHAKAVVNQIDTFRQFGLGNLRHILLELSRDPAMLFWLDNKDNKIGSPNENYGRELLELFSLGIGNYTEEDVKHCALAFTGWSIKNAEYMSRRAERDSVWPYGRLDWQFEYVPQNHDDGIKTFLGKTGRFNGDDILDILCTSPSTARFISKKLYEYFVSDSIDYSAVDRLSQVFLESHGDIRQVLRALFNSESFKCIDNIGSKVRSPIELAVQTCRIAQSHRFPDWTIVSTVMNVNFMGQEILNPPTVEGWHTGSEWIETGSLVERLNAATNEISDPTHPGIRSIIDFVSSHGPTLNPETLVGSCLEAMALYDMPRSTTETLIKYASKWGNLSFGRVDSIPCSEQRVTELLQMIVATREYQLA